MRRSRLTSHQRLALEHSTKGGRTLFLILNLPLRRELTFASVAAEVVFEHAVHLVAVSAAVVFNANGGSFVLRTILTSFMENHCTYSRIAVLLF